jgi:hypothetical protein
MYRWRELFDLYLQAGVFFSTHELDRGKRDSTAAARQLQWFQSEVTRRGLKDLFKLPASHQALDRFIRINITLLRNLKFQEINQKAISKILKSMFLICFLPLVSCTIVMGHFPFPFSILLSVHVSNLIPSRIRQKDTVRGRKNISKASTARSAHVRDYGQGGLLAALARSC